MCACRPIECDCNLFLEDEKINDYSLLLGVHLQAAHFLANFTPQNSSNMPHSIDATFEMSKFEGKPLTYKRDVISKIPMIPLHHFVFGIYYLSVECYSYNNVFRCFTNIVYDLLFLHNGLEILNVQ